ncbi:unnamed protein product [Macrosiphum euphorbiae]|uniref:Uncharacterized protein n=1 Tax=Macrosiphum euphorbiae TaxID=13131 RepID=A0AAV0WKA5_9HEMI|nr:unnamed protein product [Macrosiphum euphorbiae]
MCSEKISNECSPKSKYLRPRVKQPHLPLPTSFKYHQIRGYRYSWSLQLAKSYLLSWTCVQLWHTLTKHMKKYKHMRTTTTSRL